MSHLVGIVSNSVATALTACFFKCKRTNKNIPSPTTTKNTVFLSKQINWLKKKKIYEDVLIYKTKNQHFQDKIHAWFRLYDKISLVKMFFSTCLFVPSNVNRFWKPVWFNDTHYFVLILIRFTAQIVQAWRTVGIRGSHSLTQFIKMSDFSVEILPALQDNYMYLVGENWLLLKLLISAHENCGLLIARLLLFFLFRSLTMKHEKRQLLIRLIQSEF